MILPPKQYINVNVFLITREVYMHVQHLTLNICTSVTLDIA